MVQAIFFYGTPHMVRFVTSIKPNKNPKPNTIFSIRTSLALYQNIKF